VSRVGVDKLFIEKYKKTPKKHSQRKLFYVLPYSPYSK
jgi:hypothetical protein